MNDTIILTAWRGGTFGLRVQPEDRRRFDGQREVVIILPRTHRPARRLTVNVTPSFWRNCPEFRSAKIGRWLEECGLSPWTAGQPPRFEAKVCRLGEVVEIVRQIPRTLGR